MDSSQFLLTISITVTTVLVLVIGVQLIFVLRDLRKTLKKTDIFIDDLEKKEASGENAKSKEKSSTKKHVALHSILDKIRTLSPSSSSKAKKFFIKDQ